MINNLEDSCVVVHMGETKASTLDKPVIGTYALATCFAVLLYSESEKRAIVTHSTSSNENVSKELLNCMIENNMCDDIVKYKVIDGYYDDDHYGVKEKLNELFSLPIFEELTDFDDDSIHRDIESTEFMFDSTTGKFVSNEYFGSNVVKGRGK